MKKKMYKTGPLMSRMYGRLVLGLLKLKVQVSSTQAIVFRWINENTSYASALLRIILIADIY